MRYCIQLCEFYENLLLLKVQFITRKTVGKRLLWARLILRLLRRYKKWWIIKGKNIISMSFMDDLVRNELWWVFIASIENFYIDSFFQIILFSLIYFPAEALTEKNASLIYRTSCTQCSTRSNFYYRGKIFICLNMYLEGETKVTWKWKQSFSNCDVCKWQRNFFEKYLMAHQMYVKITITDPIISDCFKHLHILAVY